MATTPQDILNAGLARSTKNKADVLATGGTEMLQFIIRSLRNKYAMAARVNPAFFGNTVAQAWNGTNGWNRPAGAESVFRIEKAGAEVVVVPYDDKTVDALTPSVYAMGQTYRPAGNVNDPTSADTLTIYYSIRPSDPATLAATLDATWPEQFNELLALDVAIYLALKDGRAQEAQDLREAREQWLRLFIAFLEHETQQTRRRFSKRKDTGADTQIPLAALVDPRADLETGN